MMTSYIFYLLAFISVAAALAMVIARSPVNSVLYLIVTFFAIAGQYVLLNAQFLAVVHIIVYAGAIMVLFLFVLMLLNLNKETEPQQSRIIRFIGAISGGLLLITLIGSLKGASQVQVAQQVNPENGLVKHLGQLLFTDYLIPFEISAILFLAAMVGAVATGLRNKADNKETISHIS